MPKVIFENNSPIDAPNKVGSVMWSFAQNIANLMEGLGITAKVVFTQINKPPNDTEVWYPRIDISSSQMSPLLINNSDIAEGVRAGLAIAKAHNIAHWEEYFIELCAEKFPESNIITLITKAKKELVELSDAVLALQSSLFQPGENEYEKACGEIVDILLVVCDMFRMIPVERRGSIVQRIWHKINVVKNRTWIREPDGTYQHVDDEWIELTIPPSDWPTEWLVDNLTRYVNYGCGEHGTYLDPRTLQTQWLLDPTCEACQNTPIHIYRRVKFTAGGEPT